jgi:hypothetical protein
MLALKNSMKLRVARSPSTRVIAGSASRPVRISADGGAISSVRSVLFFGWADALVERTGLQLAFFYGGAPRARGWYVEFAENQAEIRLDEEWRSVLVLRSAAVQGKPTPRPKSSSSSRPATPILDRMEGGSGEQSACVQVLQFAQEFTERRRIQAMIAGASI